MAPRALVDFDHVGSRGRNGATLRLTHTDHYPLDIPLVQFSEIWIELGVEKIKITH